jgi:hypothetical protein
MRKKRRIVVRAFEAAPMLLLPGLAIINGYAGRLAALISPANYGYGQIDHPIGRQNLASVSKTHLLPVLALLQNYI